MGYRLNAAEINAVFAELGRTHLLFAPKRYADAGEFSGTDSIRYGEIQTIEEIELKEKSSHTFKEALLPISETLFYYTENSVREPDTPLKNTLIFLRSCDLHAIKRLDTLYLGKGAEDYYYKRLRGKLKFILLGCLSPFENCFCVDMETSISKNYSASLDMREGAYYVDCKTPEWNTLFSQQASKILEVTPAHVTATGVRVHIPDFSAADAIKNELWDEYDSRCIACGRCNFSCPTCTCFTMQDIFYTDNGKAGERRRVWASCMVDGFTDVAGGGVTAKNTGSGCVLRCFIKCWISNSASVFICVSAAAGAMMSVLNILVFPMLLINSTRFQVRR